MTMLSKARSVVRNNKSRERQNDEDLKRIFEKGRKTFSSESIAAATNNFDPADKLGQGGFGSVYKGRLEDGTEIAVKKLSNTTPQGRLEFMKEAELLTLLQHRNVVKLLGYCACNNKYLLVYELLPYSLDQRLFRAKETEQLDWTQINGIIIGIAKGLLYLHCNAREVILHRDIKPSNILLDHNGEPKITDFGMGRLFDQDKTHVTTRPAGTMGYVAPEYLHQGHASVKTDVYSFGVVVLELISGKRFSYSPEPDDPTGLVDWAYKLFKAGRILNIMNPALVDNADLKQVTNCIEIGLRCTQGNPKSRPNMEHVVSMLTGCQGHNGLTIFRPGIYGYRGYRSSSLFEAIEDQGDQSEAQFPGIGAEIPETMPMDEHHEAIQSQGNPSEARDLLGAKIPDFMPVDEHQSQHGSSNSNQIILEGPHSNSNTFPAQHDSVGSSLPTINNHLASSLEVSVDEEEKVPDTTSSEVSKVQPPEKLPLPERTVRFWLQFSKLISRRG